VLRSRAHPTSYNAQIVAEEGRSEYRCSMRLTAYFYCSLSVSMFAKNGCRGDKLDLSH
jgi:hypothetical protein